MYSLEDTNENVTSYGNHYLADTLFFFYRQLQSTYSLFVSKVKNGLTDLSEI